jgi:hypothetical protein
VTPASRDQTIPATGQPYFGFGVYVECIAAFRQELIISRQIVYNNFCTIMAASLSQDLEASKVLLQLLGFGEFPHG